MRLLWAFIDVTFVLTLNMFARLLPVASSVIIAYARHRYLGHDQA
jgi:hypothetical protein